MLQWFMLDLQTYLALVVRAWPDQRFNLCDTSDRPAQLKWLPEA